MPILKKDSPRNHVVQNSLINFKKPAAFPEPKVIDDRKGHSFKLEESGLVPKYTNKQVKRTYLSTKMLYSILKQFLIIIPFRREYGPQ